MVRPPGAGGAATLRANLRTRKEGGDARRQRHGDAPGWPRGIGEQVSPLPGATMRRLLRPFLAVTASALAARCAPEATAPAPRPITGLPRSLTAAEGSLVAADNRFALKLFQEIARQSSPDSNLFISRSAPRWPWAWPTTARPARPSRRCNGRS